MGFFKISLAFLLKMIIGKPIMKIRTLTYDFIGNYCLITITNIYVKISVNLMIFSAIILLIIDHTYSFFNSFYKEGRIFTNTQANF